MYLRYQVLAALMFLICSKNVFSYEIYGLTIGDNIKGVQEIFPSARIDIYTKVYGEDVGFKAFDIRTKNIMFTGLFDADGTIWMLNRRETVPFSRAVEVRDGLCEKYEFENCVWNEELAKRYPGKVVYNFRDNKSTSRMWIDIRVYNRPDGSENVVGYVRLEKNGLISSIKKMRSIKANSAKNKSLTN